MTDFERALENLIENEHYRGAVIDDWTRLGRDYQGLNSQELTLLMHVWTANEDPRTQLSKIVTCHCGHDGA